MSKAQLVLVLLCAMFNFAPAHAQVDYEENPLLTILTDGTAHADRYSMSIFEARLGEFTFLRVSSDLRHWDYSRRSLVGRRQTVASVSVFGFGIEVASVGIEHFTAFVGGSIGICLLYDGDGISFDRRWFRTRLRPAPTGRWALATPDGTEFDEIVIEPRIVNGDSRGIQALRLRSRGSNADHVDVSALERCP